jgi:hypothetical protein
MREENFVFDSKEQRDEFIAGLSAYWKLCGLEPIVVNDRQAIRLRMPDGVSTPAIWLCLRRKQAAIMAGQKDNIGEREED